MNTHPYIIQASHKQSAVQRWTGRLLTLLCWGLWCWLWWPYAASLWPHHATGLLAVKALSPLSTASAPALLLHHASALLATCAALVLWAVVHKHRHSHAERRQQAATVTVADLAHALDLQPAVLRRGRLLQCMVAHHHESGGLKQVESADNRWLDTEAWTRWQAQPVAEVPMAFTPTVPPEPALAEAA